MIRIALLDAGQLAASLVLTWQQQPNSVRADGFHNSRRGSLRSNSNRRGLVSRSQQDGRQQTDKVRLYCRPALVSVDSWRE